MYLFLSDLHLGRGSEEDTRRAEADACNLLRHYQEPLLESGGKACMLRIRCKSAATNCSIPIRRNEVFVLFVWH